MKKILSSHPARAITWILVSACCTAFSHAAEPKRPNVILLVTDDQGYGDIASHGHPHLITPNMDRLRGMSVRFENFHVDPTCAPTRAALMTGRYSGRVGVWHTIMGRNILREDETTIAQVFRAAGYRTGIFGKWHLGGSYPYTPRFRGFDESIIHGAGGVGQTPDFWGNDYFDDTYNDNGTWRRFQGYCTDVWFREALGFIRESGDQPFFLYLPTNAAHMTRPHVEERYRALYDAANAPEAAKIFWGMISNLDDNLGVMIERLEHWGLMENTVLVFMGDNGTTMSPEHWPEEQRPAWSARYNAGMKGSKASHYDGGHRVFCYIHHPAAGIGGGREVKQITAHIDIMPTLLELCGIPVPDGVTLDGKSLVPLLKNDSSAWPERTLIVQNQRVVHPIKWKDTSVMTDQWRLIGDKELYDISTDPGQQRNVISAHPEIATRLRGEYERWWQDVSARFHETTPLYIGSEEENPVELDAHDWMADDDGMVPPWNQPMIFERPLQNGPWQVRVARAGTYAFTLRERPEAAAFPLTATKARLKIGDKVDETRAVEPGSTAVRIVVDLPAADLEIQSWLIEPGGESRGAYFVTAERLAAE